MYRKRAVICRDCGTVFETAAVNAVRCRGCQKKHRNECEKARYRRRVTKRAGMEDADEPVKLKDVHFLDLPCPWADGRLPESVTRNQVWS